MISSKLLLTTRHLTCNNNILNKIVNSQSLIFAKFYAKECRRAHADIPKPDECCERTKKRKGILHRIKLKIIEGGTNFGTPFRFLESKPKDELFVKEPICEPKDEDSKKSKEPKAPEKSKALPPPKRKSVEIPEPRPGVQVSILGADTAVGQYSALLLKQCPFIKKLRLYEARDTVYTCTPCSRNICNIVQDLQHINTNCHVQGFSCACGDLEKSLQSSDIVLILESAYVSVDMPSDKRFQFQAPIVKYYADCIAAECPKAFIIVCATPVDCMVPLIAETLKETGWYDFRKLLGSVAVPEMRASTLAARALCLEPKYTRVPCVGGTEGESLVPLFSRAVEFFDFARHNAELMTEAVRAAPKAVARCEGCCMKAADLSEAHALATLVTKVAQALLCQDMPRVTGFVETDKTQAICPVSFVCTDVELSADGINKRFPFPKMSPIELEYMDRALGNVSNSVWMGEEWVKEVQKTDFQRCQMTMQKTWSQAKPYAHVHDCVSQLIS